MLEGNIEPYQNSPPKSLAAELVQNPAQNDSSIELFQEEFTFQENGSDHEDEQPKKDLVATACDTFFSEEKIEAVE